MVKFLNRAHRNLGCKGWQSILGKRGAVITPSCTSEGGLNLNLNLRPRCWCSGSTSSGEQTAKANVGLWQRSWHHRLRVKQINTPGCGSGEQIEIYLQKHRSRCHENFLNTWKPFRETETLERPQSQVWFRLRCACVNFADLLNRLCVTRTLPATHNRKKEILFL